MQGFGGIRALSGLRATEIAMAIKLRVEQVTPVTNKKAWKISVAASVLLVVAVFVALFGTGSRLFVVKTPSMGTVAPVGTLVVVHPQASYAVGEVITYEREGVSYTHRIVDQTSAGFILKGDINGATDALPVPASEIVGKVVFAGRYLGFLFQGLPWIVLGGAIVFGLTLIPKLPPSWRWQVRFIGWSLVVSLVALWQRPWVNMEMLAYAPQGDGVDMHLVNTGIFPVKVVGTILGSGQDAIVTQTVSDSHGHYVVTPELALNFWWFVLLLAICLTPMVASLFVGIQDESAADADDDSAADAEVPESSAQKRRRIGVLALIITASVVLVAIVLQWSTHATLTASISNSADKAVTRTFFSCKNAITSSGNPAYLAWALDTARGTGANEPDLSGNSRTGRYLATSTVDSTSVGCNHDTYKSAVVFNGTTQCLVENNSWATTVQPNTFSLEAWFRTSTTSNGKIIGFGDSRNTVGDTNWDRHIYLDKDGRIVFGVYPNTVKIVYTRLGLSYADNTWHHVVATLSTAGQSLYVDGQLAMTNATVTTAEAKPGYWKVGCGNLTGWRNAVTDAAGSTALDYNGPSYFAGYIQYAAVYSTALTATQVLQHYQAGA
jgi:signal peptidase I